MKLLQKIREKPEDERNKIAVGIALVIVIIIAIFWLMSLSGRFKKSRENTPETVKPFSVLENIFSRGVTDVRNENNSENTLLVPEDTNNESYDLSGKSFQELLNEFSLPEDVPHSDSGFVEESSEVSIPDFVEGVEILEVPA
jgi:hypothetical protein